MDEKRDNETAGHARVADRFVFQRMLGFGASGTVYQAYDEVRGATIAVKSLTALDPGSLFRFKSEFRTLSNLAHPNLLQLHELITHGDQWLLTMELVEGTDFLSHVRPETGDEPASPRGDKDSTAVVSVSAMRPSAHGPRESVPPSVPPRATVDEARLRRAFAQLCEGLFALHRADRLHRDLKPANVLVANADGRVVICDFGLTLEGVRPRTLPPGAPGLEQRFASDSHEVAGTLVYMSPEQALAEPLSAASDWYSAGVILYQALTGRLPVSRSLDYDAAVEAKLNQRPPHPAQLCPGVSSELARLALALLEPDPGQRAGYAQAMRALGAGMRPRSDLAPARSDSFVGRDAQLAALSRAFAASRRGSASIALVSGASGMGKSALVQHFLAQLETDANALVLRARCYEREDLPYKAVDPLIDALSSYLVGLDPSHVAPLLPASMPLLSALFPALRRVPAIADMRDLNDTVTDPRERRRLAFRAFRELCARLARDRPLVLAIDDLHWGDADSGPVLKELLTPPGVPPLLAVCAYRSEAAARSPLLATLRAAHTFNPSSVQLIDVAVDALSPEEAAGLALATLEGEARSELAARRIALEADGSPFFVRELAAYAVERGLEAAGRIRLDTLIREQLDALSPESRTLLSVIALAGRPVANGTVRSASGLGAVTWHALRDLEARRLVLTSASGAQELVECYHDRIRESACQALRSEEARALHRALAEALSSEASEDCDALLEHWRGAGERDKAGQYALRGAQNAENALAFKRAAELYREALALLPLGDPRARELQQRLGHALILAGRGPEAASVFLGLLPGATHAEALNLRMLATTQLLRSGKLAAGFDELHRADDLFGVRFPASEPAAFAMLLARRARIRLKERFIPLAPHTPEDERSERSARLDALWEVAAAVSTADLLRGGVYSAELMLRAMDVGDPAHIAGACGLEAVLAAASSNAERTERMLELAERAEARAQRPHLAARVRGMKAICRHLQGRWQEAAKLARECQELQRRSPLLVWESATALWYELTAAAAAGQVDELATRIPEALRDAEARGDVYAATSFRTHRAIWAWLADDRPDAGDQQVDVAETEWNPDGYQFQHWHMTCARSDIDLYRGTPRRSFERLQREWRRGRLVRQVQGVRPDMLYARARLALALADEGGHGAAGLIALARKDATQLIREQLPWTIALGQLVLACAASFTDRREAAQLLVQAEVQLTGADMRMHAEAARAGRGELTGGSAGQELIDSALRSARALGAKRPEGFVRMLAPIAGAR